MGFVSSIECEFLSKEAELTSLLGWWALRRGKILGLFRGVGLPRHPPRCCCKQALPPATSHSTTCFLLKRWSGDTIVARLHSFHLPSAGTRRRRTKRTAKASPFTEWRSIPNKTGTSNSLCKSTSWAYAPVGRWSRFVHRNAQHPAGNMTTCGDQTLGQPPIKKTTFQWLRCVLCMLNGVAPFAFIFLWLS